ncbi:MAG: hypothetical protein GXO74_07265 [Calditrichaeota bacterium]|nr:hypothetical protein [Calditrichota bacterium]
MNKIVRNTLILSSVWVLMLIIGVIYIYGHQKKLLNKLKAEEKQKSERLADLRSLQNDLTALVNYYKQLKENSLRFKGTLASFVLPGETFDYIRRELIRTNSTIKLDMDFENEEPFKNMIRRNYILKGTGKFTDIYNFFWFLENGPVFYNLGSLTVEKTDQTAVADALPTPEKEASFNLKLVGYDRKEGPNITEINNEYGEPERIADIFEEIAPRSRFAANKPAPRFADNNSAPPRMKSRTLQPQETAKARNTRDLAKMSNSCEVLAITPFSVLIKDANGKIIKLRKGDKIYGGTLTTLDAKTGKAIFQYDNQPGARTFVLTMQK